MGMALRGRQHASGFAIGLAEVAIGGAGGEAALRLHGFELGGEGLRSEGEPVAQRGKGSCARRLLANDMQDQAGDQRLGFLVPMRLARFAGGVIDQRSEEHTSELQSLMRISYAVFCLKKKNKRTTNTI